MGSTGSGTLEPQMSKIAFSAAGGGFGGALLAIIVAKLLQGPCCCCTNSAPTKASVDTAGPTQVAMRTLNAF
jgi:hypothetical protein